ncbi:MULTISPECIES: DUF6340 family protein [unclassified Arenibacter]|uniref:DUF6340 family protein n=1 Tax=unclassified Arenibacter TaxID=2615047 RepID=UPI000E35742B|nr:MULTISPECIES: DUF6340 family protein [unclassified Arenibacter]MCM4162891.1 hypothetical protein [Arenibacter sp. A80]RFT56940.1 hypothetical protein D0S24_04730 [Arenibacter sp. P308M17]
MKNYKLLLGYIGIGILLMSCSATNNLTMGATEPAIVHLPKEIQRIGIINRSLPSEVNRTIDKIDQILSAEGLDLDRKGAEVAINALSDELAGTGRFEEILILDKETEIRKGLDVFPASLSWEVIEEICAANGVDAIFSLAFYDTDTQVSYKPSVMQLPNNLGVKVSVPAHEVTLNTLVKNGWRIYNPRNRQIVDEFMYTDQLVSSGKGINPVKAIEAIARRNEAVETLSMNMGFAYGSRLSPYRHRISRDYFVRGTDNFVVAKRRAQTGDWQGAAQLWEKELDNSKPKIAGRACYNMAIINEINGDLNTAMDWASKSYADYDNKEALLYLNILKYRLSQNEVLEQQASR